MAAKVYRAPTDPTGYVGPLGYVEVMIGGKHRVGSGLWAEAGELTAMVFDAAFVTKAPLFDSHGQLAHYTRPFELFDKDDPERRAELGERIEGIPHLADFHVDIDLDGDLEGSRTQAEKLVRHYLDLGVPEPAIGIRFSGKKGFDISLPWQVLGVKPQGVMSLNWTTYKLLGQDLVKALDLKGVDVGLWRRNGTIRLENTQHPSGLFKIRIDPRELKHLDTILELAKQPRLSPYTKEAVDASLAPVTGAKHLYLPAQARADVQLMQVKALRQRPLDPEVLAEVEGKLVACLRNISRSAPSSGTRNETVFHAAMMLKLTGRSEAEARTYARQWLGRAATDVGSDATVASVYTGPYAGGCRWMRESGFASPEECARCPIGQRRYVREARKLPELPKVLPGPPQPSLAHQREALKHDFEHLNPDMATVIKTPAGLGKSYRALQRTVELVAEGKRVLWFVKDTRKEQGLAADLQRELREVHDYRGKVQVLYGRDKDNCDNWSVAKEVAKKGYSVGKVVCRECFARSYCEYYAQYDRAYEPGVYIAPHAMLPILFADEWRGFSHPQMLHTDPETLKTNPIGAELALIVIDEDALDVMIERFWVGGYHLEAEARRTRRTVSTFNKLTGNMEHKERYLDRNWLKVVEWLRSAIGLPGPTMPALRSVAEADGGDIRATMLAINPAGVIDPTYKRIGAHRPFSERLYNALMRELERLADGNFTIWNTDNGLEILTLAPVQFPGGIPVAILDAYANEDLYRRYFRAAGVNRLLTFYDYPVREQANVTYVLGANLLASDLTRNNKHTANRINSIMRALQKITSDGVETYIVAKRAFFESDFWREWESKLPNCVADGDAGQLYFWRGRGINAASGKRIAILQVPNFHPNAVLAEASVLYADEPRLDNQRIRVEEEMVWAREAEGAHYKVDKMVYADERLNLVNERYRMDELVQMALRSRSLTTGAEIIIFADLPDPRLPAAKVLTVAELANDTPTTQEARQVVYDVLREHQSLNLETVAALGLVAGRSGSSPLRATVKAAAPEAFLIARQSPVEGAMIEAELAAKLATA